MNKSTYIRVDETVPKSFEVLRSKFILFFLGDSGVAVGSIHKEETADSNRFHLPILIDSADRLRAIKRIFKEYYFDPDSNATLRIDYQSPHEKDDLKDYVEVLKIAITENPYLSDISSKSDGSTKVVLSANILQCHLVSDTVEGSTLTLTPELLLEDLLAGVDDDTSITFETADVVK